MPARARGGKAFGARCRGPAAGRRTRRGIVSRAAYALLWVVRASWVSWGSSSSRGARRSRSRASRRSTRSPLAPRSRSSSRGRAMSVSTRTSSRPSRSLTRARKRRSVASKGSTRSRREPLASGPCFVAREARGGGRRPAGRPARSRRFACSTRGASREARPGPCAFACGTRNARRRPSAARHDSERERAAWSQVRDDQRFTPTPAIADTLKTLAFEVAVAPFVACACSPPRVTPSCGPSRR